MYTLSTATTKTEMEKLFSMALQGFKPEDICISLKEPGTHVFDSIIIRDTLENHFGFEIPDHDWRTFTTLSESVDYCYNRRSETVAKARKVMVKRNLDIRLPQMANSALSENWLLKEMGDMHWELLSKGLGQQSTEFADSHGNRLYAAFLRINYAISPLDLFGENETMHTEGNMKRFGDYAYYSAVNGHGNGKTLRANLMTSFLGRTDNDNSKIARGTRLRQKNQIEDMENAPDFHMEYRQLAKGKMSEVLSGGHLFAITDKKIASITHTINPHFEINGAGLFYFASYPIVADMCTTMFFKSSLGINDHDKEYHTTWRDIFFFANCNADDRIVADLNSIEEVGSMLKMTTSLYRESDSKLMARVLTVKQKRQVR